MTLDEIALEEELTVDGVTKARKTALRKMKEKYPDSKLCLWRKTYHIVMKNQHFKIIYNLEFIVKN
jgi:hypothetical protein